MCRIEYNSKRASRARILTRAQNSSFGREYRLLFAFLGLATIAVMLITDRLWAQLREGDEVVTVTNAYWVRLRSTPEIRPDTILTRVAGGAQLKYLGTQDEWFKVGLSNGAEGWLHSSYGHLDSARDRLQVSASVARIRETPEQDSPVIGRAIQGLMLEILEEAEPWYLVRLPLGEEGWVRQDLVTLHKVEPKSKAGEPIVAAPPKIEDNPVTQVEDPVEEPLEANLLEITPLPISASASSKEEESQRSSPTLRSPQNLDKPRFLMLFVSVIAGLSAFAVILVVGAVAIRRRQRRNPLAEITEAVPVSSPDKHRVNREYSDPLLKWMSKKPFGAAANGNAILQMDQAESAPRDIGAFERESLSAEIEAEDPPRSQEAEVSVAEDGVELPVQDQMSKVSGPVSFTPEDPVLSAVAEAEKSIPAAAAPPETAPPPPVRADDVNEGAESGERDPKSSRSRSRRKGKRRRRRR